VTHIGARSIAGFQQASYSQALDELGFKTAAGEVNLIGATAVVVWLMVTVGMVYGPLAAFMVEMFPAQIRSTSLSVPYNLGVGIMGGFLPFVASALVIYFGNVFAGLWYPVAIALATALVALVALPETNGRLID
jgi:hypothetical protein